MNIKKSSTILVVCVAILQSVQCYAQESAQPKESKSFSFTPLGGFVTSPYGNQLQGYFLGGEFSYDVPLDNSQAEWPGALGMKKISYNVSFFNTNTLSLRGIEGTNGVTGEVIAVSIAPLMVLNQDDAVQLFARPRLGFAYLTKNYDQHNYLEGSNVNFLVGMRIGVRWRLSSLTAVSFAGELDHISNGSFKLPNSGLNPKFLSLGIEQGIGKEGPRAVSDFENENTSSFEFSIGAGRRDYVRTGYFYLPNGQGVWHNPDIAKSQGASNLYQIGMYGGYNYHFTPVLSVSLGSDVVYYTRPFVITNNPVLFMDRLQERNSSLDHFSVGISVNPKASLGRFVMGIGCGYYIHYNSPSKEQWYWTVSPEYHFTNWLAADLKVNYHRAQSGYVNVGMLFNFLRKQQ